MDAQVPGRTANDKVDLAKCLDGSFHSLGELVYIAHIGGGSDTLPACGFHEGFSRALEALGADVSALYLSLACAVTASLRRVHQGEHTLGLLWLHYSQAASSLAL